MSIKTYLRSPLRRLLGLAGFDIVHHSAELAVRLAGETREALRLDPGHRHSHIGKLGWSVCIAELLDAQNIDVVLDVGANAGQFRAHLSAIGYSGPVHSFEPIPDLARRLETAAVSHPGWHVHRHAVGAREETRTLHVLADDALSSLRPPTGEATRQWSEEKTRVVREIQVPVRRLDSFIAGLGRGQAPRRIFLKTDTQGSDLDVFVGCGDALDSVLAVQFEAAVRPAYQGAPCYPEVVSWLEARGFVLGGFFPVFHHGLRLIEFDCVMLRPPSP